MSMALVSIDGHKAHKIVDGSAICAGAVYALEHGGVSFSRLIADREFSTAIPSSPGAVRSNLAARLPGPGYMDILLTGGAGTNTHSYSGTFVGEHYDY